jgi:uncharacterized membrane protein
MNNAVKYDGLFHISDWLPTIMGLAQLDPNKLETKLDGIDHSGKRSYKSIRIKDPWLIYDRCC